MQTKEELNRRVDQIALIFKSILEDDAVWNHLGAGKQQQLITGINKSYGQAMSFLHEFVSTQAAEAKGRHVVTQTHADVTIGRADQLFAKSIECKSVTKPEKGAVNKVIADALEQLGGQTGHHPRTDDVRIIDLKIDGWDNPWPEAGGSYGTARASTKAATLLKHAESEVKAIVDSNKQGATAVRNWLMGQTYAYMMGGVSLGRLSDIQTQAIDPGNPHAVTISYQHPHSTRPVYQAFPGQIHRIRCLTIKIRYEPGYLLDKPVPPNHACFLSEIVIQVYRRPDGTLWLETAKVKKTIFDFSDPNNVGGWVVRS